MTRPFEFALVSEGEQSPAEWRGLLRQAEDLGYGGVFVTDHCGQALSPVAALSAAAATTDTLRVGTFVLNVDLRNHALLAHELATLQLLSGGRTVAGLGAGWLDADYQHTGIARRAGHARLAGLRAAVARLREDLADRGVPQPTILLGGARRRMLEYAAAEADIVSVMSTIDGQGAEGYRDMLPGRTDTKVGWVRSAVPAGRARPVLNHVVWECFVTPRPAATVQALAGGLGCTVEEVGELAGFLVGTAREVADVLLRRRERWGFSLVTVPSRAIRSFAPVVELLCGPEGRA
ncbi:LLM class flavin-dependent oxidoreductase [Actinophytocola xanthii]|uniref:Luciferase-like domain-containing protein n=1 Tax=Actinophytocola xanthii TaxID=1912961 RepID=A0A1Q8CK02_9PSEU|nr:LLM class flavin-dependent oxidoreductase [Actinophytocola xanthii]OLF14698.1 hypothetical protein BU204_25755 [Actinophytocola xanthii]